MNTARNNEKGYNQRISVDMGPFRPTVLTNPAPLPTRITRTIQLSNRTIADLNRLTEEYETGFNEIIEWSVAHFSYSRTKGE